MPHGGGNKEVKQGEKKPLLYGGKKRNVAFCGKPAPQTPPARNRPQHQEEENPKRLQGGKEYTFVIKGGRYADSKQRKGTLGSILGRWVFLCEKKK